MLLVSPWWARESETIGHGARVRTSVIFVYWYYIRLWTGRTRFDSSISPQDFKNNEQHKQLRLLKCCHWGALSFAQQRRAPIYYVIRRSLLKARKLASQAGRCGFESHLRHQLPECNVVWKHVRFGTFHREFESRHSDQSSKKQDMVSLILFCYWIPTWIVGVTAVAYWFHYRWKDRYYTVKDFIFDILMVGAMAFMPVVNLIVASTICVVLLSTLPFLKRKMFKQF